MVVILPRNYKVLNCSPEAQARLDKTIAKIEQATAITIDNHQLTPEITFDMYRDATHLARYSGDIAYTKYLAEQYSDSL
ncbi:MAG: hypothetical protein V2I33_02045 [Kangiellaceae bacterium]|nr:hypothetical protein [Kangiellaceae bacterium]